MAKPAHNKTGLFPWGITSQYLAFFLLTSILPMLVISLLFYKSTNDKFNDRINSELDLGVMLAENVYHGDMRRLEGAAQNAAIFYVGPEYNKDLASNNTVPLKALVEHFRNVRQFDIVTVFHSPDDVVARSGFISDKLATSYNTVIKAAFKGTPVSTIEAFRDDHTGNILLGYLSAAPIRQNGDSGPITGVLVLGRSVSNEYSFQQLLNTLPSLEVRILMKVDDHRYQVLSASNKELTGIVPDEKGLLQSALERIRSGHPAMFRENGNGQHYKSKAAPILDYMGDTVGYIIVSTSEADFHDLRNNNLMYILLYMFAGLGIVGMTGLWFQKALIKPVDDLSRAFTEVADGNLDVRVRDDVPQPEVSTMLAGFNRMLQQLKETERLRDTFISSLTHDLRTPVTAQKRVLETLTAMNGSLDPEVSQIARGLLKNNEDLLSMINKLLEASQYEAGSIKLNPETIQLHALVETCCHDIAPIADSKDISFRNEIPRDFPSLIADPAQLKRVITNLLHNAVENIGHHKQVTVSARDIGNNVLITVSDNGPGVPEETLPKLFERYFSGHKTRQKIGSGLGLFICRMIVEYHGGHITAQSEPGKGASFIITLPKIPSSKYVVNKRRIKHAQ